MTTRKLSHLLARWQFNANNFFRELGWLAYFILVLGCVLALSIGVYIHVQSKRVAMEELLASMVSRPAVIAIKQAQGISLPPFQSNLFVAHLHKIAIQNQIALDEVVFSLENLPGQPFMRYQTRISTINAYPAIRQFIDELLTTTPNATLDGVHCMRADINDPLPRCDLIFSTFFQKDV